MSGATGRSSLAEMNTISMQFGASFIRLEHDLPEATITSTAGADEVAWIDGSVAQVLQDVVMTPYSQPIYAAPLPPPLTRWQRLWALLNMDVRDVWKLVTAKWRNYGS